MQALILAAGRGTRMGKRTAELPKCLLEVGGKALIEHQLEALADCGVGPVGLVVGYRADDIREVVGIRAEYIHNSRWRNTNSLYSFSLAQEWVNGDLLVLNSDLLFSRHIIERLLAAKGDSLAFDSSSGYGAEHMKVQVSEGRVVQMSKTLDADLVSGENVGILSFSAQTAETLFQRAAEVLAEDEDCWLGAAVSELTRQRPIEAVDINGLAWAEIDFPFDLHHARKRIWPQIRPQGVIASRVRRALVSVAGLAAAILLSLLVRNSVATPTPTTWELIEPAGVESVQISSDERSQRWWRLESGQAIEVSAVGPARLRIESRLQIPHTDQRFRYAIALDLGDDPLRWDDHLAEPTSTWQLADTQLSKRKKIELKVPEGESRLRLRLVTPDASGCLVRIAQEVAEAGDE